MQGMWDSRRGFSGLALLFLCLLAGLGFFSGCGGGDLKYPTEYQAVILDNGQVFFGRLGETDAGFLTLRDVYYVQRVVSGEKKEAKNVLLKRGHEWHGPDFMRINTRHVVLIEPVAPDSRVAQLIRETKAGPAAPAAPESAQSGSPSAATPPTGTPQKRDKKAPQGRN